VANYAHIEAAAPVRPTAGLRRRTPQALILKIRVRLRRPWLDRQIARGVERTGDRLLELRAAQLVSHAERTQLARRFEEVLAGGKRTPWPWPSSIPVVVDRQVVEVARPILTELILSLRSADPVEARGVLLGWRLLTEATSPVYTPLRVRPGDPDRLWHEVLAVLFALRPLVPPQPAEASAESAAVDRG
jgi:hypothetical protein